MPVFIADWSAEEFESCATVPSPKTLPPVWTWFQTQTKAMITRTARIAMMKMRLTTLYLSPERQIRRRPHESSESSRTKPD